MRVLQLGPFPPPHGGVQTNLVAIREYLRRNGIECAVINLTRFRRGEHEGVHYPRTPVEVVRLVVRLQFDIFHLHVGGRPTARLLGLGLLGCVLPRAKAVLTLHSGGFPSSPQGRKARRTSLLGFVFRRFDGVIAVNREIERLFLSYGVPRSRLRMIPPFAVVPVPPESGIPERLVTFADSHGPLLLTIGLLEPEYDLPLQIEMLPELRRSYPDAGLMIIGSGSREQELYELVAASPDSDHILLCGDVPHPATLSLLKRADLLLRTTLYDGDAISVREALTLGVPVIATDNGMRPDGVDLVPPHTSSALLAAIERRLRNPGVKAAPAAQGGEGNLDAILRLYEELTR